ncbi:hypothetical protein O3P69_004384 [Scylla paramamosain]|uniref:Uncharacterized protein n=1 Tax=Scylla paramamosain TaxID=85552 RepID=A0AAW0UCR1_SCYPA
MTRNCEEAYHVDEIEMLREARLITRRSDFRVKHSAQWVGGDQFTSSLPYPPRIVRDSRGPAESSIIPNRLLPSVASCLPLVSCPGKSPFSLAHFVISSLPSVSSSIKASALRVPITADARFPC